MLFTALNHQLRRMVLARPVTCLYHHQSNVINICNTHLNSNKKLFNPISCIVSSSCVSKLSSHCNIKQLNLESQCQSSLTLSRLYSTFNKNVSQKMLASLSHPPDLWLENSSKFVTLANATISHNDSSKLLTTAKHIDNLMCVRDGHHIISSRDQRCPLLLTHKTQGFQNSPLFTPWSHVQQTRGAVNIPKMILDASPNAWQPYLNLIRFDKPIGTWLLYWPCTWSIALAAQPGYWPDFYMIALFGAGAFFMRGAGCIINDMWDKDFDIKVERTRERPLACDKVTYPQAFAFLASQLAISLAILLQLNWYSIGLGVASMGIVITYPTFKRFTYWPQIVLGFAFNYGALLGWAAIRGSCDWSICIPLYFMCHMWTMVYDTIYAHQDKTDDLLVGVKSTALRFGDETKLWLSGFTTLMAAGLLYTGHVTDMTWPYYTGASLTIASILVQLYRLDIDNPQACGDAFRFHFYMGLLMFVSIMLGNKMKPKKEDEVHENEIMKESISFM